MRFRNLTVNSVAIAAGFLAAALAAPDARADQMDKLRVIVDWSDPATPENPYSGVQPTGLVHHTNVGITEGPDGQLYTADFLTGHIYRVSKGGDVELHATLPFDTLAEFPLGLVNLGGALTITSDGTIYASIMSGYILSDPFQPSEVAGVWRIGPDGGNYDDDFAANPDKPVKVFPLNNTDNADGIEDILIITGIQYDELDDALYFADCKVGVINRLTNLDVRGDQPADISYDWEPWRQGGFAIGTWKPWQFPFPSTIFADARFLMGTGVNDISLDRDRGYLYAVSSTGSAYSATGAGAAPGAQILRFSLADDGELDGQTTFRGFEEPVYRASSDIVVAEFANIEAEGLDVHPDGTIIAMNVYSERSGDTYELSDEAWALDVRPSSLALGVITDDPGDDRRQLIIRDSFLTEGGQEEIKFGRSPEKLYITATGFTALGIGLPGRDDGYIVEVKNTIDFP